MKKIKTIFDRDWNGDKKVIPQYIPGLSGEELEFSNAVKATEKLDGTNVRLTVRNHTLVRLEKRNNPTKLQKAQGIEEPWYVDASQFEPNDKYIYEAALNTDLSAVEDGEWSGEALGPSIQGNPLNLEKHIVFLFSVPSILDSVVFEDAPSGYEELKEWLPKQQSKFGKDCGIEGIVWYCPNGEMFKIKLKDFKF